MTGTVDTSKAMAALESLADAMKVDASTLVADETRRLAKTIANFTPPLKSGFGTPQRTGEHAIERELSSLFSEATPNLIDEVGSKFGIKEINTAYVTERNGTHLNLQWGAIDATGDRMAEYHKANRDPNTGKVKLIRRASNTVWAARVIVPTGSRDPYVKQIKARVGRAKAKWALIAAKLGEKIPNWINRHFGSLGGESIANLDGLANREKPSIIFGTIDPNNRKIRGQVQAAVNLRAKAMANRARLMRSGYAKDVAQSIRPRPHASETKTETEQTVE
jgi:hypothetical protein